MQLSIKNMLALPSKEAKAMVLERGREIQAGRVKMIPHEEVMREMEQLLASYAD